MYILQDQDLITPGNDFPAKFYAAAAARFPSFSVLFFSELKLCPPGCCPVPVQNLDPPLPASGSGLNKPLQRERLELPDHTAKQTQNYSWAISMQTNCNFRRAAL